MHVLKHAEILTKPLLDQTNFVGTRPREMGQNGAYSANSCRPHQPSQRGIKRSHGLKIRLVDQCGLCHDLPFGNMELRPRHAFATVGL